MRRWFHPFRGHLVKLLHIAQNRVQLFSEALFFLGAQRQAGQLSDMLHLRIRDQHLSLSPSLPQTSGEWLHRCELGQQFLDAIVANVHREFELCAVPLTFLHHPTAEMLMEDLSPNRIGWLRSCCT